MAKKDKKTRHGIRKLRMQVGEVIFAYYLILIALTAFVIYSSSIDATLKIKQGLIEKHLKLEREQVQESFFFSKDNWENQAETYSEDIDENQEKELAEFLEKYPDVSIDELNFSKLTKGEQEIVSHMAYSTLAYSIATDRFIKLYSRVLYLDIKENDDIFVIFDSKNIEENNATKTLGENFDVSRRMRKLLNETMKSDEEEAAFIVIKALDDDRFYYVGVYPIVHDGKTEGVICLYSDMHTIISNNLGQIMKSCTIITSVLLIVSLFVILIILNKVAIVPLNKLIVSVKNYMNNKNSKETVKELERIKSRNEIGVLADDMALLSKEMDHYTQENIRLAESREKTAAELELASRIQNNALIKEFPENNHYSLYATMTPAMGVGGDFYDFFNIDNDNLALVIADVSGKGIPAAMFMMTALTAIRHYTLMGGTPAKILEEVNEYLVNRGMEDMFVTIWLGVLELSSGKLVTANAGHEFPAIKRREMFGLFEDSHGIFAGGLGGIEYENTEIQLMDGDAIFVYTDGVPEANYNTDMLFGLDRMIEVLNSNPEAAPKELINSMIESIHDFVGDSPQFDDTTMLCIKYRG